MVRVYGMVVAMVEMSFYYIILISFVNFGSFPFGTNFLLSYFSCCDALSSTLKGQV